MGFANAITAKFYAASFGYHSLDRSILNLFQVKVNQAIENGQQDGPFSKMWVCEW